MLNSKIVYWTHFIIVSISHIAAIAMSISTLWFVLALDAAWQLKTVIGCMGFFLSVLGINHVTSRDSVCCLTSLERYYRNKEGLDPVEEFIPRYYSKIRKIFTRK